jgi:hypothetical protein
MPAREEVGQLGREEADCSLEDPSRSPMVLPHPVFEVALVPCAAIARLAVIRGPLLTGGGAPTFGPQDVADDVFE